MEKILLTDEEHFLYFTDEHWVVLFRPVVLYLVGTLLSGFLFWLGLSFFEQSQTLGLIVIFVAFLNSLVTQHGFFLYWISLNVSGWAITTQRIIDFNFLPYVRHDMMYISVKDVTEIEKHQRGIMKNMLHFGEVEMNLTSSQKSIVFKWMPYPGRFVDLVSNLQKSVPPTE